MIDGEEQKKLPQYLWTSSRHLRSLFLPELHFSLHQFLSPACLLLQSFFQFLASLSLLLQSVPPHLHLTLLQKPRGVNNIHHQRTARICTWSLVWLGPITRCSRSLCFSAWASRSKRSISSIFAILDVLALKEKRKKQVVKWGEYALRLVWHAAYLKLKQQKKYRWWKDRNDQQFKRSPDRILRPPRSNFLSK